MRPLLGDLEPPLTAGPGDLERCPLGMFRGLELLFWDLELPGKDLELPSGILNRLRLRDLEPPLSRILSRFLKDLEPLPEGSGASPQGT